MKKYFDMLYVDNFVYIWFGWSLVCVTHFCHFAHYCYFHQLKLYIAFRKYSDPLHFFQFNFIAGWNYNCLNSIYYWKQLGYSRTFTELSLRQMCVSGVALAVCLGSLSCWKVNLLPSLRSWALWNRFSLRIYLYFSPFDFPATLTSLPVPASEKHPHSMRLLPAHFTFGMVLCRWWAELVSFKVQGPRFFYSSHTQLYRI